MIRTTTTLADEKAAMLAVNLDWRNNTLYLMGKTYPAPTARDAARTCVSVLMDRLSRYDEDACRKTLDYWYLFPERKGANWKVWTEEVKAALDWRFRRIAPARVPSPPQRPQDSAQGLFDEETQP